jgi:hypothetical protein
MSVEPPSKPQSFSKAWKGKEKATALSSNPHWTPSQGFDLHAMSNDMYDDEYRLSRASSGDPNNDIPLNNDGRDEFDDLEVERAASESASAKLPPLDEDSWSAPKHLLTKVCENLPNLTVAITF